MTTHNEVYITGMGLIASAGYGGAEFIQQLPHIDPKFSAWPEDQHPPAENARVGLANEYPVEKYFTERQLRLVDRAMVMALCTVGTAFEDGKIDALDCADEVATIFGSMRAELSSTQKFSVPLMMGKPKSLNPAQFPMIARNVACGQVAMNYQLRGMSSMICTGPLSSLHAISRGYDLVRRGRVPMAIVGGVETLSKFTINHTRHLYQSHLKGDSDVYFTQEGGALVPAEGCGMLILESAEHANKRGAVPYAKIIGSIAGRLGADQGAREAAQLLTQFIARGGDERAAWRRVGFISSSNSGSATPASLAEMEMLRAVYEQHDIAPAVTAPRSWIGEAESVASALQVQVAAQALKAGVIPPTRSAVTQAGLGLNVARSEAPFTAEEALVTAFDDAMNYTYLRLARVSAQAS